MSNVGRDTQDTGTPQTGMLRELRVGREEKRGNRWGSERLGRNDQQDLAPDLTCTHVGGKLPEIDYKQCSATVATFLNFWESTEFINSPAGPFSVPAAQPGTLRRRLRDWYLLMCGHRHGPFQTVPNCAFARSGRTALGHAFLRTLKSKPFSSTVLQRAAYWPQFPWL